MGTCVLEAMSDKNPLYAVLGGSFDPPHLGHADIIQDLLENVGVGKVLIVPTFHHVLKNTATASFHERMYMALKALVAPFENRALISTVEQRIEDSRTFNVLSALANRFPGVDLHMVVGADIIEERSKWYRWEDIQEQFGFIVYEREGYPTPPGARASVPNSHISSTLVRKVAAEGGSLADLVHPDIIPMITTLYGPQE